MSESSCVEPPRGRPAAGIGRKLQAWLAMARPPFHSVGVLPFVLGGVLAWRHTGLFRWDVCVWGVLGVVLIMLSTYLAGEYWDYAEDEHIGRLGRSRFAGGSGVPQSGMLSRRAPLWGSLLSLALALGVGLVLQLAYRTGPWTLPFGLLGMLGGFFYSSRPVRWVERGWGELWIAFCYGWLPVAVGYYLQTGVLVPLVHWLAVPVGLTIFNVILLNEFPDHPADRAAGKANLTVRLGLERASVVYALVGAGSWLGFGLALAQGLPARALWFYLPVLALSLALVVWVLRGRWRDRAALEWLCGANIGVNLGTTLVCVVALLVL